MSQPKTRRGDRKDCPLQTGSFVVLLSVHFMVTAANRWRQPGYSKKLMTSEWGWGWTPVQSLFHFLSRLPPPTSRFFFFFFLNILAWITASLLEARESVKWGIHRSLMRSVWVHVCICVGGGGGRVGVLAVLPYVGFTVSHFNDAHPSTQPPVVHSSV